MEQNNTTEIAMEKLKEWRLFCSNNGIAVIEVIGMLEVSKSIAIYEIIYRAEIRSKNEAKRRQN